MKQVWKKLVITLAAIGMIAQPLGLLASRVYAAPISATVPYVALGDSVAAGAGLPLSDNSPETLACGRSSRGYPHQFAQIAHVSVIDLACGGATVPAGIAGPQTAGALALPAQIDRAFQNGTPKLITLTVGTNDIHWSEFIGKCYQTTCGTWSDSVAIATLEWQLYGNLNSAMAQIKQLTPPGVTVPHVAVVGYYLPVSQDAPTCANTIGLTPDEISWIRAEGSLLNDVLRLVAAEHAFASYVPVSFAGHELCTAEPWVQGLSAPAPYHPTAAGQTAIAEAVAANAGKYAH